MQKETNNGLINREEFIVFIGIPLLVSCVIAYNLFNPSTTIRKPLDLLYPYIEPQWVHGRWEEKPISGINLTRWMEFRNDGTVERGQLEKTTTNIQSYKVEGDLVIVDNYISDKFYSKLYYKKIDDGVLARANSSGTVESSDRYYKK